MTQVKLKIKKGDQVVVLSGSDKGKRGEVLLVKPSLGKAIVEGVNIVKKHIKPSANKPQGGVVESEALIQISNLAVIDPESNLATRVGFRLENGKKIRFAKKSGKTL